MRNGASDAAPEASWRRKMGYGCLQPAGTKTRNDVEALHLKSPVSATTMVPAALSASMEVILDIGEGGYLDIDGIRCKTQDPGGEVRQRQHTSVVPGHDPAGPQVCTKNERERTAANGSARGWGSGRGGEGRERMEEGG